MLVSVEANVYHPERADLIEGSIGELSMFHETFGYYAQGVGEETATLPAGWQTHLIAVRSKRTRGATGWCLEVHDLIIAKAFAGREEDERFITVAMREGLASQATLLERLAATSKEPELHATVSDRLSRWCTAS